MNDILTSDHHRYAYVSNKKTEEYIHDIFQNQVKTNNPDSLSCVFDYLKNILHYEERLGTYALLHTTDPHNGTFCYFVFFLYSSPAWWTNMVSLYDETVDTPLGYGYEHLIHAVEAYKTKQTESENLNGSLMITPEMFYILKNKILHIDGWEKNDPPMECLIVGQESQVPVFKFSRSDVKNCTVSVFANSGQIHDVKIVNAGKNYDLGDIVGIDCSGGYDADFLVNEIGVDGKIKQLSLLSGGKNYRNDLSARTFLKSYKSIAGQFSHPQHPDLFGNGSLKKALLQEIKKNLL